MINELKAYVDKIVKIAQELGLEDIDRHFYTDIAAIKVYFHGGFDYGKKSSSPPKLIFTNKEFESYAKHHCIRFEELKVTVPYYEEPDLLLTVFGDEEIESTDKKNLKARKDKNYPTLPLIIFTEDFFHIPYGEVFAYTPIIETLESCTESRVIAFNEDAVRGYEGVFSRYLFCISFLKRTLDLIKVMDEAREKLSNMIIELYDEKDSSIDFLLKSVWIKQIGDRLKEIDILSNSCNTLKDFIFQELFKIQEENKNNVLKRLRYFKASPYASTFAKDILLKHGAVIKGIDIFTEEVSKNKYINSDYQIVRRLEETKHYFDSGCEFATIGTFSSGKTTFINTLLASRHKLRTSAAHNTAVLLKIYKAEEDKSEYSRVIFKDKIELDLLEPAATGDLAQLYGGKENAKVISIDRANQRIKLRCSNSTSVIHIENEKPIIVTEGQFLKPNDKLTEGYAGVHNCRKVQCVCRAELEVLISEVKANRLSEVDITLETENKVYTENGNRAVGIIKALLELAGNTESTIDIGCLQEVGLDNCYQIKLSAKYNRNVMEIILDNNGWRDFCDDGEKDVYLERPECYVFAKEIHVFMKSSFLDYCTVIDTPGFGSVTEKHDAISERYLMEHNGILLIMIKISNATEKLSMKVLLNKVESIYNNNSNLNKQNVTFILNCFSNSTATDHLIRSCRNITKIIVGKGFSKNKIFVCNLKRSIENNEYLDRIFNEFPSYKLFSASIRKEIEEKGIMQKLMGIKTVWEGFFESKISKLARENRDLENGKWNRERIVSNNEFALMQVKDIEMSSFTVLKNKYMEDINLLLERIGGLGSKKDWQQSKNDVFESLRNISEIDNCIERDYNKVYVIASRTGLGDNEIPEVSNKKKFILPIETFKGLYEDISYNRSWGLFWVRKNKFKRELKEFLEAEINKSFEEMEKQYYKACNNQFEDFKEYCISILTNQIDTHRDDSTSNAMIVKNEILIKEYRKLQKSWSILSNLILKTDYMKNIS